MDYHSILGVDKNASQEEIRQAYERQVEKFKAEIKDERRAEKFLRLFKEAYDALREKEEIVLENQEIADLIRNINSGNKEKDQSTYDMEDISENNIEETVLIDRVSNDKTMLVNKEDIAIDKTMLISRENIEEEKNKDILNINESNNLENTLIMTPDKVQSEIEKEKLKRQKEKAINSELEQTEEEYIEVLEKRNNDTKHKNNKKSKPNKHHNNEKENKERDNKKNNNYKSKKVVVKKKKSTSGPLKLLLIPFRILAFPIVVILSALIFICRIISMATWLVSKALMVGAIGVAAIHGYEVYLGRTLVDYNVFLLCVIAAVVSILLPFIIKVLLGLLERINNVLKKFVF